MYSLVETPEGSNVTAFVDGGMYVADNTHPNWEGILEALRAGQYDNIADLFDSSKKVSEKFEKVSERVSVSGGTVYFDGESVDSALARQILRFMDEGVEDWKPLVNFFEKVAQNPQEHSREQLYTWLDRHAFTIASDGDIVAYKGVQSRDGKLLSSRPAPAKDRVVVNGTLITDYVDNQPGSVVEMPRNLVDYNAGVGCSVGLHVGTYNYAKGFLGTVLEVRVNPRDIVSVPTDCDAQKVRCCRYKVVKVVDQAYDTAMLADEDFEDEDESCYNCASVDCYC